MPYLNQESDRLVKSVSRHIQSYFDEHADDLGTHAFHYFSRMYLWTKIEKYRKALDAMESEYIGTDKSQTMRILRNSFENPDRNVARKEYRKVYLKKYSDILGFNKVLWKYVFAESIYGKDVHQEVFEIIDQKKLLFLYKKLYRDTQAIAILSTLAINFFYNVDDIFQRKKIRIPFSPDYFFRIAKKKLVGARDETLVSTQLYLLTHIILGESRFYQKRVRGKLYKEIVKFAEEVIMDYFTIISLDNKLEFLVCARLCGYNSPLRRIILGESIQSFHSNGNFIIENTIHGNKNINDFDKSEHRNVLFLMACLDMKIT